MFLPNRSLLRLLCDSPLLRRLNDTVKSRRYIYSLSAELLKSRAIIKVSGEESESFLQGLITNDITQLRDNTNSIYAMFLNSKGRILHESLIYKTNTEAEYFIDTDVNGVEILENHLKMFRLRKKVNITKGDDLEVWAILDCDENDLNNPEENENISSKEEKNVDDCKSSLNSKVESLSSVFHHDSMLLSRDPRLRFLGFRLLSPKSFKWENIFKESDISLCGEGTHKRYRFKLGIAEGLVEIPPGECFPLEYNCDYLSGVSFSKGCYIGQELTARTHHTGVVRKRVMPIVFSNNVNEIELGTSILSGSGKNKFSMGKLRGFQGNIGIGLMRVKEALEEKSLQMNDLIVIPKRPFWWPKSEYVSKQN